MQSHGRVFREKKWRGLYLYPSSFVCSALRAYFLIKINDKNLVCHGFFGYDVMDHTISFEMPYLFG